MISKVMAALLLLSTSAALAEEYPHRKLTQRAEIVRRTNEFKSTLRIYGMTASGLACKVIIETRVTKYRDLWSGWCTIKVGNRSVSTAICMDDMVGNFAMSSSVGGGEKSLAEFAEQQCGPA